MKATPVAYWRLLALGIPLAATTSVVAQENGEADMDDEVYVLSPFEVTTDTNLGYMATNTLAGTRIRTDLADVGSAISVVTEEFMEDVGATDNASLLQYTTNSEVGGTQSTYAGLGNGTSLDETATLRSTGGTANRVRGLDSADNARDYFVSDIPWDSYNVSRIDIQRGPNAILFGLGSPAGIINASLDNADYFDRHEVTLRVGSFGSWRGSFDINRELIENTLAIRVEGLWDHQDFRQKPAFENDERQYVAVRWDPRIFKNPSFRTTIKANYSHGRIDANRPRMIPPNDRITPWFRPTEVTADNPFGGMNKLVLPNGYAAEYERYDWQGGPIAGDGLGYNRSADPDYNAWITSQGNQQQPFYFFDGASGELYELYGGFINNGARNSDGTVRSPSSELMGRRYSGVFYGVTGLPSYATNKPLPGQQYGQYREQTLRDPTIFDFYNKLIDGTNKEEWEDWDEYNFSITQTAFDDRIGLDLAYNNQEYNSGGESLLGWAPAINVDILGAFQDLSANPNVGRPYVAANGSGSTYSTERETIRLTAFGELRWEDFLEKGSLLQKILGTHRFTALYNDEQLEADDQSYALYATGPGWEDYMGLSFDVNDRPPIAMIYLGESLLDANSAQGANINRIRSDITLQSGPIYTFDSTWTANNVAFDAAWDPTPDFMWNFGDPTADNYTGPTQASNPANYVGWTSQHQLDVLNNEDDNLVTSASSVTRKVESYAGIWQSYFWEGAIVGTLGWRYDTVESTSTQYLTSGDRATVDFDDPESSEQTFKNHSLSWGVVAHIDELIPNNRLPLKVSLSTNYSENFRISNPRFNIYGEALPNQSGDTRDYGITLSTRDNKYSFRAISYKSTVNNASTQMSNLASMGNIISYGLRWRNVFLYDLNTYDLSSANGSNEWRYNFDPAPDETQEQATARENAAIAAWNEVQEWVPDSFYQYWGWTAQPPADLANPTATNVYPYPVLSRPPAGFTMTADTVSEGYEFEFVANPTRNWRISANASKVEATRNNVGGPAAEAYINYLTEVMAGPAGELRMYSGGPNAHTLLKQWNSFVGSWTLLKLTEGSAVPEIREWSYRIVTNYEFDQGMLNGVGIGGAYRWADKVVIGYPVVAIDESTFTYDLSDPYYGPSEDAVDLWLSYERKLTDKVNWQIQLNVRNAFADKELIPISVQPDGETWASARIGPAREWFITSTFTF